MIQAISFRGDRSPVPPRVKIGFESDNLVESLAFELPEISGNQSAMLMVSGNAYANMIDLYRTEDGKWAVDLTAEMVGTAGVYESYVAITCPDGRRWNSGVFDLLTGDLPDISGAIEALYPTAVEHVLQEMAETRQEMAASVTASEDAAQRAEDAAQRAEDAANQGGGSTAPAKDAVLYTAQELTEEQKAQARDNIGAASAEAVGKLSEEIEALKGVGEDDYREETITPDIQGYFLMTGSFNNTTTKARRTDYISLEGCTLIKAQYRLATNGCAVAFFDENKTFMSDVSVAGVGLDADTITEIAPPAGAAYVMLSHYLGSDLNYVGFITLSYGTPVVVYDGNLAGVTVDVLGDSISSVAYVTPNYWQMIAEKTGCVFNDYAVSGTRIATVEGDAKESFLTRAARMDTNADAVLVMGGTNDVGLDTLLGEWNSEDTSTFYGALNALITLLRTNFPGKPIIFCTPIKRKYDSDNGFPDTMADLKSASATEQITMQHCVLAIKAKCARHGIPVIDLAEYSGFSAMTPEYYRAEDDNLHPSALGYVRIANMVQAELEKQFTHTAG